MNVRVGGAGGSAWREEGRQGGGSRQGVRVMVGGRGWESVQGTGGRQARRRGEDGVVDGDE